MVGTVLIARVAVWAVGKPGAVIQLLLKCIKKGAINMNVLILIITIWIVCGVIKRIKRRRAARLQHVRTVQAVQAVQTVRNDMEKILAREKIITERLKKEDLKQAKKDRLNEFKTRQAVEDINHLEQQKHDILKLYNAVYAVYKDPDKPVKTRQAAYARMIGYDNKIRNIEKNIEKARFIISECSGKGIV